jgi:transposase-like protein
MQYQEAVAKIRRLEDQIVQEERRVDDAKYEQARLIAEQFAAGVTQRQLAADTNIPKTTLQARAKVWERFGQVADQRPPYAEAHQRVTNPDFFENAPEGESVWTTTVRERTKSTVRNLPPEEKAAVVREALDDQDVAVRVLRDPHTRRNVTDAREQVVHEIEGAARDRTDADPQSRAIREASLTVNIESNISKARFWLTESARQIQDLEDRDPAVMERLARDLDEVELALGWLRTALEGGRVNDEDLARLLDEGGA